MKKLLIIEDEKSIRNALKDILKKEEFEVFEAENGKMGIDALKTEVFNVILCDIKMPIMDGIETLKSIKEYNSDIAVIMLTGHGDLETAVECIKLGAYDFISKPPDMNHLLNSIRKSLEQNELKQENKVLRKKIDKKYTMIGSSESIMEVHNIIRKVAPQDVRVLITGPNGSGKELVTHWIHQKSNRNKREIIEVNCAAIPSELIESELFGHEKGAFTSANAQRKGKFEIAHEGTLFLDEIGDLSLSAQAKILRVLQEKKITRVGGNKDIHVNVRLIAATNKDLVKEIENKNFREDLYHRIAVITIKVPPLKQRKNDIPLLVEHFLEQISKDQKILKRKITAEGIDILKKREWCGNIRELKNAIERLVILSEEQEITVEDIKKFV